ncbi:MAG: hypothetical protein R3F56_17320 [Planctomycetota bacterium]
MDPDSDLVRAAAFDRARIDRAAASVPLPVLSPSRPVLFVLGQSWRETAESGLRATRVHASYGEGILHVVADMDDEEVFNDASAHNQRTWELGDVFEIFARPSGSDAYREVHVTPDNVRLHLCFDDFGQAARIGGIEDVAADPDAIVSRAGRTPNGWSVTAHVPLAAGADGHVFVSFCRYDAARGRAPILSSSSLHPVLSFHRPWEWTPCRVEA